MKSFRSILTNFALLPITGCIFPGHRDTADDAALIPPACPPKADLSGLPPGKFPLAGPLEVRKG